MVEVALKNYDDDSFNTAVYKDGKKVDNNQQYNLYAVAVDNTKEDEIAMGKRNIISTYDLTLEHGNFDPSEKIKFLCCNTSVKIYRAKS